MMISADRPQRPGRGLRLLPFFLAAFVSLAVWRLSGPGSAARLVEPSIAEFSGATMGTTFSVKIAEAVSPSLLSQARNEVARALTEVDQAMSTYLPDSELSRLNRNRVTGRPIAISEPLREVIALALAVGEASDGALDITIAPIVDAWGFGPERHDGVPEETEIAELRRHVGLSRIALTEQGLVKRDAAVQLDLSAVAKGYAVDAAAQTLSELGLRNYLVEVGGEVKVRGRRANGSLFRVGIERPAPGPRAVARAIPLADMAVATSGDYRNFFVHDGRRKSHIIDPRTTKPVDHDLASVTVLHNDTASADAWATALFVLGPSQGAALARTLGLAVLFIVHDDENRFRSSVTPAFSRITAHQAFAP